MSDVFRIDAEGRVRLGEEAQRRLAARPGDYHVVPAAGGLIVLQRVPDALTANEGRPPDRVVLSGELDPSSGVADLIHFISGNNWSGQLALFDGPVRKSLFFRRGDLCTAASNVPEDRLGAILYRYGIISAEQLEGALTIAPGAAKLGHVLVERGHITAHVLYTYVRKQVEEIFYSVLSLRAGDFFFQRTGDDGGPPSQLQISTKSLLFEGVTRIDELSYFQQKLPSFDVVVARREPQPSARPEGREQQLLDLVDGARDLGELSRLSHLGEFETTKVVYQLLQAGHVQVVPPRAPFAAGADQSDAAGKVVDTFNYVYAKIHAAVASRGRKESLQKGLDSFFGSVADFAPLFVGVSLAGDGTLPRDLLLANLELAPAQNKLEYLHRGLNELLFFELFTAGEAVDRREEMELHQRLNQILRDLPTGAGAPPQAIGRERR